MNTHIWMEPLIKVIGLKTSSMVKELKGGQMGLSMKDSTNMVKSTVEVFFTGLIIPDTKENFLTTTFKEKVLILGKMVENSLEIGSITRWRGREFLLGQMVDAMKEIIEMIRKKVMEYSLGQMADAIKDIGKMAISMDEACTFQQMARRKKENGLKENA